MDNFQIETAQNVSIYQNVAGIGDRLLAFLIDFLIIGAYTFFSFFLLGAFGLDRADQWEIIAFFMVIGLPVFLYYLLFETFWDGKTPGKSAMKLKVVKLDGSKPGFGSFFVRWIMRIIDISLSTGGVAVVTILLNDRGQRLGDIAAGTTVISEKKQANLSETLLVDIPEGYVPTYPQVTVFSDKDMQTIKTLYSNARSNGNHNVIVKLSDKLKTMMSIEPSEKPFEFVNRVIADYNYYTQR
ncbi:RDD family protein [Dokdonia sinensis]|uniref:RDD family protein n=1 Tax=Dokdonia sinensis TaxID=2479847 RepID=A0A3M0GMR6_9FLAO|nr:RDD family protein [Dokdonia sinensis]RMB64022.1 RDD family protein [Dokdonia sinensis]